MFAQIGRLFGRMTRSLDAASSGRRWNGAPVQSRSLNHDVIDKGRTVAARAGHAARNNAHAAAALNGLVSNIIGPGIKPASQHPDPETRERIHDLWAEWTDDADLDGAGDFYALQALAVRQMVEVGESFGHLVFDDGPRVPLKLRLIHADQVPRDWPGTMPNTRTRAGIEMDAIGRVIAYHVLPFRPDDPLMPLTGGFQPIRIPAGDIAHLFVPHEPGQLRGLSWFAPVLLALHELDQHADAALVRAKVSALVMAALTDPNGDAGGMPGDQDGAVLTAGMEPGTILNLPPGTNLEFFDPKESANYGDFIRAHLRAVAAGLGIPYELLTGDLAGVSYSSIRAGLVEFRRKLEHWQHNIVVYRFCRPIWRRFIEAAALAGLLPGFEANNLPFYRVDWLAPKQDWVDPKKDAEAEILAIAAGLKSRSQSITERGYDPEKVDADIALDRQREERLKLSFSTTIPTIPEVRADA